jgi:hypothetical protein
MMGRASIVKQNRKKRQKQSDSSIPSSIGSGVDGIWNQSQVQSSAKKIDLVRDKI